MLETISPPEEPKSTPLHAQAAAPHLEGEIKEPSVFQSLWENLHDAFFPAKLPPLVLESTPIAVPDRMAVKRDPTSTAVAVGLHAVILLLILFVLGKKVIEVVAPQKKELTSIALPPPPPPILPRAERMGGGGGQHDLAPATQGHLPKIAPVPLIKPAAPPTEAPKIPVEPTIDLQKNLKMDSNAPNLGQPNSNLKGFSLGNGSGAGIGGGNGNGLGPGSGGNTGGGVRHIGGSVRAPVLTYSVEPEFSEEARKAKFSGNVLVYLVVDENGNPSHVRVVRGVGMGLDEKAVEAVRQYKFKPALENGKPVKVDLNVEVNFQIF